MNMHAMGSHSAIRRNSFHIYDNLGAYQNNYAKRKKQHNQKKSICSFSSTYDGVKPIIS